MFSNVSSIDYYSSNNNTRKRKRAIMPSPPSFDYAEFAASIYRKHLPLDLRLDLQQWFTMVNSARRGRFGCRDPQWLRIAQFSDDHIDNISGVVGCAVCLLTGGRHPGRSSLLEDMLVQELISTKWRSTPRGQHNLMSYCAVNDPRIAHICQYTIGGRCCGKLVHLAPPTQWLGEHPHPTNHFVWREGNIINNNNNNTAAAAISTYPFRGTRPRNDYYQCRVHGEMKEYRHPSGQWSRSRHGHDDHNKCPGRLCDLQRIENYWTWKTFIKYLVTDKHSSKCLARFYKVAVLGRAALIQRVWRGYFARTCIVPFTKKTRAAASSSSSSSPTCVWSSRLTIEREWSKRWFEFLMARRFPCITTTCSSTSIYN